MQISYTTKEQQKAEQQTAFLKLTPAERFQRFLDLMDNISWFGVKESSRNSYSENFIIEKKK